MAALENTRHERFAQELAKGKSATDAMREAGYSDPRNSTRLTKNDEIQRRVAELQERAAARTEITVAGLTEKLLKIAEKAEGKDEAPMLSVARAAYMDAAKLNGLIIDQAVNENVNHNFAVAAEPEPEDAEEWARQHRPN